MGDLKETLQGWVRLSVKRNTRYRKGGQNE